jgi:hypothetical protein
LHDEQTVNELMKIAWASVFRFPFDTAVYTYVLMEKTANHNFCFAANRKRKRQTSVSLLKTET